MSWCGHPLMLGTAGARHKPPPAPGKEKAMPFTVKQLIEKLQALPKDQQDLPVAVYSEASEDGDLVNDQEPVKVLHEETYTDDVDDDAHYLYYGGDSPFYRNRYPDRYQNIGNRVVVIQG